MTASMTMETEPGTETPPEDTGPLITGKLTQARQEGNDWNDIDGYLAQKREQANKFGYSDADVDKFLGYQDPTRRFDDIQNKAADNVAAADVKPGVSAADLVGAASGGLIKLGAEKPLPDGPLPIELRNEYAQALMNGEVKDAGDFAEKYANTVGAAASFGGEFSGEQVGQFQGLTTELQKKLPDLKSLIDYSIGLNPADPTFTQQQMMQRWVQTGETPDQVYQRAQTDAQVRMELTTPRPPDPLTVAATIQDRGTRPTPTMTLQNVWNVFKAAGEEFGTDTQGAYDYLNTHFLDARSQPGLGPQLLRSVYALVGGLFAGAPGAVLKAVEQTGIETGQPQLGRDLAGMLEKHMIEAGATPHALTTVEMSPEAIAAIKAGAKTLIDTALDTRGSGPGLTPLIPDKDRPLPPVSNPGPDERASIFHEAIPPEFLDPKNKNQTAQIIHDDVLRLSGNANNNKTNFDFRAEQPLRKERPEWFEPEFGQKVIDEIENRGVTGKPVSPDVAEWEQHPIINGARQSHWEAMEEAKNIIYDMEKREDAPPYERRPMPSDYLPRTIYNAQRADPHAPAWTQESAPTAFGSKYAPGVPSLKVPGERQFYVKEYDPKETGARIREVQEHSKDTDKVEVNQRGSDDKGLYTVKDATIKEINDHTTAKAAEAEAAGERARPAPIYRMKPFENLRDALLDARYKRDFMQTLQRNQKLLQDRGLFIPVDDARAQLGNWQKDIPASFEDLRTGEKFEGGAVDLPLGFRGWVPKPFAEELERLSKTQGVFDGGELGAAWNKMNMFMLRSLFVSPVPHTLNVLGHWAMGRGLVGTFAYPGLPSMVMNGARAYLEVKNIGPIYSAIEREGAGLQYGRTLGQTLNKAYLEQTVLEMQRDPDGVWRMAANQLGFTSVKDLVAGLYNASNRNLWFMNDVMAVQRVMELMDYNKLGMREAIRQMQREIVTYDLPVRTLGSRGLSQLLADNKIMMFARYDYGRVKLFGNMIQDMVGMGPHGAAGIPHAIDQALMFAAMTAGVYGVNKAIKDATGYDVSITSGPLFLADMVKKLYDGKRLDAIPFHISPVIGNLALAAKNMNWQGKPLVGGQKDAPGQVSDAIRAAAGMIPPLQTGLNIASGRPASTELTRMLTGINVKTPDQVAAAEAFKKREAGMERSQEGKDWLAKLLGSDVQPPAPKISVPRGGSTAAPPSGFIGPAPRARAGGNQAPSGYIKPSSPRTRNK